FDPSLPDPVNQQQPWKLGLGLVHKGESAMDVVMTQLGERLGIASMTAKRTSQTTEPIRGRKVAWCEFDVQELMNKTTIDIPPWDPAKNVSANRRIREQSKYPAVVRDIAF